MRVRVVIPCRNEAKYIERCLMSLVHADRDGVHVEVQVCDGLSDDGTMDIIDRIGADHRWIRRVDNPDRTTPHAMNLGLKPAGYDVGVILGAHAEVDRAFIRENLRALAEHPEAGCVGGIIENVYDDVTSRRIGAAMGHPFGVGSAHFRTGAKEGEVDTVAFGAYRRQVFERIGYFDERLVRNQDDEFNYRVLRSGWKIILDRRIRSKYYVRASYSRLFRQYRQYGYWKVYVNRSHGSITTLRQLVPAAFVAFVVAGGSASLLWPPLLWPYLAGLASYLTAAVGSAFRAAATPADAPGVWWTFLLLHSAYGGGYLHGIWDFLVLRREPRSQAHALTR
ncbi:MAG: glycosyltransferase family 2 protein [Flavobacteriales bacterium]|nr:glycosyltransferase family 2 protein [Flavobacteriales bacterium]